TIRIKDAAKFMTEIVGTDGEFTEDEIADQIRNIVVQRFSRVIAGSGIPVLDMAANTADLSKIVAEAIEPALEDYGLSMPELYIENVSLPPEVEAALDKRTSMGIVGDLSKYAQFAAAEAMGKAAAAPDGGMGAGIGAGLGMAMGAQIAARAGEAAARPAAAVPPPPPPPPPPAEALWHIAENGQTRGPYGAVELRAMAGAGTLTRATMVWTAGQEGWKPAGEVAALAGILARVPPPPPVA
ncbi:MAG: SPFH domain-containing protein, partial [Rhodobacteraceae bacterium]|nr:SPFH domain-containing protein [Paracoccaceae bacterium]